MLARSGDTDLPEGEAPWGAGGHTRAESFPRPRGRRRISAPALRRPRPTRGRRTRHPPSRGFRQSARPARVDCPARSRRAAVWPDLRRAPGLSRRAARAAHRILGPAAGSKKLRERIIAQGRRRETRDRRGVNAGQRFGHRQGLPGKRFRRLYGPAGETDAVKANGFHQAPTGAGRRGQPPRAGCRTQARQGGRCDDRHGSAGRCFRVSGRRSRFRAGIPPPTRPRKAAAHG